jgi:hypothetical protein
VFVGDMDMERWDAGITWMLLFTGVIAGENGDWNERKLNFNLKMEHGICKIDKRLPAAILIHLGS